MLTFEGRQHVSAPLSPQEMFDAKQSSAASGPRTAGFREGVKSSKSPAIRSTYSSKKTPNFSQKIRSGGASNKMSVPHSNHSARDPRPLQSQLNTYPNSMAASGLNLGASQHSHSFGQYQPPAHSGLSQQSSSGPKVINYD